MNTHYALDEAVVESIFWLLYILACHQPQEHDNWIFPENLQFWKDPAGSVQIKLLILVNDTADDDFSDADREKFF